MTKKFSEEEIGLQLETLKSNPQAQGAEITAKEGMECRADPRECQEVHGFEIVPRW